MKKIFVSLMILVLAVAIEPVIIAQRARKSTPAPPAVPAELYSHLEYRDLGFSRGGRVAAVTGIPGNGRVFYMGATGGGVWKSEDSGATWKNISDGYFGGTIGAVEVSKSDPNIVYVAGGEVTVRGNVSHGYGIWKSLDAGETWEYKGLREGQYIPRLRVHPTNPDLVYAAVLGHLFGQNSERGIYRSVDGGSTWDKILYVDENTGGCDLIFDPSNPRIIYASTWRVKRTPYSLESGGEGSALWKSTDGGDTWKNLMTMRGMPKGPIGIIGVTVSPANPKKVYAIIEANEGGLFASNDGGLTWSRVSDDRNIRQRAWYYSRINADPEDENIVYVLNVAFNKSTDGGRTFSRVQTPHGDHHDLWIDPYNPKTMIVGDDGGAQVSNDGGETWSTNMNQPTAQFYRVVTDDHFPYRIYGAQQDNSTVRIYSRTSGFQNVNGEGWESTAGGESGWIAPDPLDNDIVYGGSYGGYIARLNHRTGETRRVDPWPDNPMGWGADSITERFQWNFPILYSKHDKHTLYAASNRLFRTTNEGQTWDRISPDLTRNDKSTMGPSGGPITKDNTSVEYYGTIFTVTESDSEEGVIWTGSDDGLVQVTRDNGKTWSNVTPGREIMPEWTMINSLEADPYNAGGVYVAATSYKSDDFTPYLYHSTDYGSSWKRITNGIDPSHFTRVIRADPVRKGMLFCGTESGMYISFNDGDAWVPFQLNLPVVPVTDLTIKGNDLIVATQGRGFWIFGDLNILRALNDGTINKSFQLLDPVDVYNIAGRSGRGRGGQGSASGANIIFYLKDKPGPRDNIRVDITDSNGDLVRSFRSNMKGVSAEPHLPYTRLQADKGINRVTWDLNYPGAMRVQDMILWSGSLNGPKAVPGDYTVKLVINNDSVSSKLTIMKNPLSEASVEDLKEQFRFLIDVRDKLTETHKAIVDIRSMLNDLGNIEKNLEKGKHDELISDVSALKKRLTAIEEALYQTKNRSSQDPLNYPIKLGNKLAALNGVAGSGDFRPTDQDYKVRDELVGRIDIQLKRLYTILENEIPSLNEQLRAQGVDYIKYQ